MRRVERRIVVGVMSYLAVGRNARRRELVERLAVGETNELGHPRSGSDNGHMTQHSPELHDRHRRSDTSTEDMVLAT